MCVDFLLTILNRTATLDGKKKFYFCFSDFFVLIYFTCFCSQLDIQILFVFSSFLLDC